MDQKKPSPHSLLLFFALAILLANCAPPDTSERMKNIDSIFTRMEADGINTNQELLFSFYFFDKNKKDLEALGQHLSEQGYRIARLELMPDVKYLLNVEKVAVHSRESLLKEEVKMVELSVQFDVDDYDGWEVGNADPTKPLVPRRE